MEGTMRVTTAAGQTFLVKFKHEPPVTKTHGGHRLSRSQRKKGQTTCEIWRVVASDNPKIPEGKVRILSQTAVCAFADQFKKETGRKRALAMALVAMYPQRGKGFAAAKGNRKAFWDA